MARGYCRVIVAAVFFVAASVRGATQDEQQFLLSVVPLIERNELSAAERRLTEALARYPHSAILHNALGIVYEKEKRLDDATAAFEQALRDLPSFTAAQLHLAPLYQRQGRKKEAAPLFAAAGEGTTNFEAVSAAALGLAECDDFAGAIVLFEKADRIARGSPSIAYNLALALYRKGEYAKALQTLDSPALTGERDSADFLYLRGRVHESLGKPAADELAAACQKERTSQACLDAALSLIRDQKFLPAVELLEGSQQRPDAALLTVLGLAQFRLGRYREAVRTYERAMADNPSLDAAREGLGFLLYITGDLEKARTVVEAGLAKPNPQFYLWQLEAMILYRQSPQLRAQAEAAVNRVLKMNPNFAPAWFLRGKIETGADHLDAALADLRRAAELDPRYPLPWYKMSQIYLRQGRAAEAETARQRFTELGGLREDEVLARQTQDMIVPGIR